MNWLNLFVDFYDNGLGLSEQSRLDLLILFIVFFFYIQIRIKIIALFMEIQL